MDQDPTVLSLREETSKRNEDRLAITIPELIAQLRIGRSTYYKLRAEGKMPPSFTLGRRRLTTISALERWLRQLEQQNNV